MTTHLILAARAFGASIATYSGERDRSIEDTVKEVVSDWGGQFRLEYAESWRDVIMNWKQAGKIVHLTMYGLPIQILMQSIQGDRSDKLVVVGGAKVPGEVYGLADWNVAVTSQPHSEVSALAVFLHELFEGRELLADFEGARLRVVPKAFGKEVKEHCRRV